MISNRRLFSTSRLRNYPVEYQIQFWQVKDRRIPSGKQTRMPLRLCNRCADTTPKQKQQNNGDKTHRLARPMHETSSGQMGRMNQVGDDVAKIDAYISSARMVAKTAAVFVSLGLWPRIGGLGDAGRFWHEFGRSPPMVANIEPDVGQRMSSFTYGVAAI